MSHRFMLLSGFFSFLPTSACTRGLSCSLSLCCSLYIYLPLFLLLYIVVKFTASNFDLSLFCRLERWTGFYLLLFFLKKLDMYRLSCTTDLPPVCPKRTGSTAFPHKPLPKQIWRGSGTLSLLSGVTKFRKHQVYVCVCVSSWICKQAAAQNASLLMWFCVCGGVCVLLCGFESGN